MTDPDASRDESNAEVAHVEEIPVCHGCGLMSHLIHPDNPICRECFQRGERRAGGGPLRVVTLSGTYHETPLCPAVRNASEWRYWRDEDCMYADMWPGDDFGKCRRCHHSHLYGFDHYRGDQEVRVGHV